MNHVYAWLAGMALAGLTFAKVADVLKPEWVASALVWVMRHFPNIEKSVAENHDALGVLEDKIDAGVHQALDTAKSDQAVKPSEK